MTGFSCFQDQTLKQILIPETGPKYLSWPSVLFSYSEHGLMFQSSNEQGGLDREPRVHYWLPGTWSFINEMKANHETSAKVWSNEEEGIESDQFFHAITWSLFSVL